IKALHEEGIKIKLHCFDYGRGKANELNKYCEVVYYYERARGWKAVSISMPYIVKSRANPLLLENLLKDEHPVLMEGIHCTAFLKPLLERNRKVFLRLHNVEFFYYSQLFQSERNLFKKLYFLNESMFLRQYERKLPDDLPILAVSNNDAVFYNEELDKNLTTYLPVFIPFTQLNCVEGVGTYCLYHGNLSVAENEKAAAWLLNKVFSLAKIPFIIAGKDPSKRLIRKVQRNKRASIISNPTNDELDDLIAKAQIHVLPSFNKTGIKLKLINALYNGRHCVVNEEAVEGSGLEDACHIGATSQAIASIITQLFHHPFGAEEIGLRKKLLDTIFNNRENARQLIQLIW
ncbi:MAG TPA: glycosyltransferase family 4 protein, partial [Chitinophagaceae bacterium]|nr:glycosyltransferase family 4 protein [Chitinophagaceae bacterium]